MLLLCYRNRVWAGLLLVVAFSTACTLFLLPRTPVMQMAKRTIVQGLSSALGMPVQVESVEITAAGDIKLHRVTVEKRTDAASFTVQAGDVVVDFSFWRLVRTRDPLVAISRLRVHSLTATLTGAPAAWSALLPATTEGASQRGLPFPVTVSDVRISWPHGRWSERLLSIASAGGNEGRLRFGLRDSELSAAALPFPVRLSGNGEWQGQNLERLALQVQTPAGAMRATGGVSWAADGNWDVTLTGKRLRFDSWFVKAPPAPVDASIAVAGPLRTPQFTVATGTVQWSGWQANRLEAQLALQGLGGSWSLAGSARLQNGAAWHAPFADLRAGLRISGTELTLHDGTAVLQGGQDPAGTFNGRYNWRDGALHFQIATSGIPVQDALVWPKLTWPVTGEAQGTVDITGTPAGMTYTIDLAVPTGTAWGEPFTGLTAQLTVKDGVTRVQASRATFAGGVVRASGTVTAKRMDLAVTAAGLQLDTAVPAARRLAGARWPAALAVLGQLEQKKPQGAVDVSGTVSGLPTRPAVDVTVTAPALRLAGQAAGRWQGRISGQVGSAATSSRRQSAAPVLAGQLTVEGELGGHTYGARLNGQGWGDSWRIDDLAVTAAGGRATLQGEMAKGSLSLQGDVTDFPAWLLGTLLNAPEPMSGTISGSLQVSAQGRRLAGEMAWQAPAIAIGDSQLRELSGRVRLDGARLHLDQWQAQVADRTVQVDGFMPLPQSLMAWVGSAGSGAAQMDLTVAVPSGPLGPLVDWLALLPQLQPVRPWLTQLAAVGEGKVHIGGTLQALQVEGEAAIRGGTWQLPEPWGKLEHLQGKVRFTGPRVELVSASASGLGGKLSAAGSLEWRTAGSPAVKGQIGLDVQPRLAGVTGALQAQLKLDGTLAEPRLTGQATVARAEVDVTEWGKTGGGALSAPLNPHFDVDIDVRQLRVRAAALVDIPASGKVRLSGRLSQPALTGELEADRGRINYLGTNFTIEEARAEFTPFRGLMPYLSLLGTTWVGRTTIALRMNGVLPSLQVTLGSEPPLRQHEILALLEWPGQMGLNGAGNGQQSGWGLVDILQGGIEMGLVSGLEDTVRDRLGLDEFHLEPNLRERRVRLSAGKYLLPRIYVTYGHSLFAEPEGDLGLEYRLDNGWKLSAGVRDGGEMRVGLEARMRF